MLLIGRPNLATKEHLLLLVIHLCGIPSEFLNKEVMAEVLMYNEVSDLWDSSRGKGTEIQSDDLSLLLGHKWEHRT